MRRLYRIYALMLTLALTLSLTTPTLAAVVETLERHRAVVVFDGEEENLWETIGGLPGVKLLHHYDLLFSGAAVEATSSALEALKTLPGVRDVALTGTHALPQSASDPLLTTNSLDLMALPEQTAYTGDGMVIAVIDTGLRYTHEAFAENGLAQSPAISQEDIDAFVAEGGTPGAYLSSRIPFAFDYCGYDQDVFTTDSHGTHVSALAAGYAVEADGALIFRGAAPAAQLLSMKVFPDSGVGADDTSILKALEDACALGADVVCLSLGAENGFSRDNVLGGLYSDVFRTLREAGILLCCAAGNSADALSAKTEGVALPTADYTDYGTISAPGSYLGATAIAAAETAVCEDTGYIAVGDRQIDFQNATSSTGSPLPLLEDLADRRLTLVSADGLGRTEDYTGRNVKGKVVLVQRGVISFEEKTANAAAAGAVACLVYNNESGDVLPSVDQIAIPCASISRTDGEYLLELAKNGPVSLSVHNEAYLYKTEGGPAMLAQSAWGTTSDLRLTPAMTAPGGNVLSASAAGDDLYTQLSGTSMAAPNAAGACVLALERAYDLGAADKKQAADLALSLLECTARPLTDQSGTPLSPRWQGTGLIHLSAALESDLLIHDPLLEPGDSAAGRFSLSFRVENRGAEDLDLTVDATVLTDNYIQEGETFYSLLTPLDITKFVTVSGGNTIQLPAGGEKQVTLHLSVDAEKRRELMEIFPNGFFTEGFITLTPSDGPSVHATFLGYCGDWESAPIVELTDFRDVLNSRAAGEGTAPYNLGINMAYLSTSHLTGEDTPLLGENPGLAAPALEDRFAIPTSFSSALHTDGSFFTVPLYTLRNARNLILVISDRNTGKIYWVDDKSYLPRSWINSLTGEIGPAAQYLWGGTDMSGQPLPDGTQVLAEFYGWVESDAAACAAYEASRCVPDRPDSYRFLTSGAMDRLLQWSVPITIDRAAPTAAAAVNGDTLTITLRDDQFLARATVTDNNGEVLAEEYFAEEQPGLSHTLELDLSDYEELPEHLYVTAADYATNTTGFAIHLTETDAPMVELCPMSLLKDVKLDSWYHEAVDLVWEQGLMSGKSSLVFAPYDSATRGNVVSALYALAGKPVIAWRELPFNDVRSGAEYHTALQWAYTSGLVSGYDDTTFGAFANVSRQQLAVLLYRYAQMEEDMEHADPAVLDAFSDKEDISTWAVEAMAWAVEAGILSGGADGTLGPCHSTSRAELAQILMNFTEQ